VLSELSQKHFNLTQQRIELENQRIVSALRSSDISSPSNVEITTARGQLASIRADIQMLEGWEQNSEVKSHLAQLRKKEKNFANHVKKLERVAGSSGRSNGKIKTGLGLGCLSVLGLGTLFASITGALANMFSRSSESENLEIREGPKERLLPSLFKGCLSALVPLVGVSLISFGLFALLISSRPDSSATPGMGVFFLGIGIGYILGVRKFFQILSSSLEQSNPKSRIWYALLSAVAVWIGVYLFFLTIMGFLDPSSEASGNVVITGFCLGPLIAMIVFSYMVKPEARIWMPVKGFLEKHRS
jgi:hypothetical protein